MLAKQAKETLAMIMIGDGFLTFVNPRRHAQLWQTGPEPWRESMRYLADHPELTRWMGAGEAALGFWLAFRQHGPKS